jgi:hypothetical protein
VEFLAVVVNVLLAGHQLEILQSIVEFVTVDVVDDVTLRDWAVRRHPDHPMLTLSPPIDGKGAIAEFDAPATARAVFRFSRPSIAGGLEAVVVHGAVAKRVGRTRTPVNGASLTAIVVLDRVGRADIASLALPFGVHGAETSTSMTHLVAAIDIARARRRLFST